MKIFALGILLIVLLVCCGRNIGKQDGKTRGAAESVYTVANAYKPSNIKILEPVEALSRMTLLGKWLEVDPNGNQRGEWIFEGNQKRKADYLLLKILGDDIVGKICYQKQEINCRLIVSNNVYYLIDERGVKYKVSRIDSSDERTHNGIGLEIDDISLGFFQRSDVLEKLDTP